MSGAPGVELARGACLEAEQLDDVEWMDDSQSAASRTILSTECLDAEPFTWRPQCFHRFAFRRSAFIALLSTIAGLFCTACGIFAAMFVCFASVFCRASMCLCMLFLRASRSFFLSSKLCLSSLEEARKAVVLSFAIRSRSFAIRVFRSAVRILRLSSRISSTADGFRPHTGSSLGYHLIHVQPRGTLSKIGQ